MTTIFVSPGQIRKNRKLIRAERFDELEATIFVWEDGEDDIPRLVREAIIYGQDGLEAARIIYRAEGIRGLSDTNVSIQTENKVGYAK